MVGVLGHASNQLVVQVADVLQLMQELSRASAVLHDDVLLCS